MSMTAEQLAALHRLAAAATVPHVMVSVDELRELLTASEELERAKALLREAQVRLVEMPEPADILRRHENGLLRVEIYRLLAAHDARTSAAATTAGEAVVTEERTP